MVQMLSAERRTLRTDFAPVANGAIEADHLGTRLDLRLTMSMKGRIWIALWFGFIVVFGIMQVVRELTAAPNLATALQRAAEAVMGPMMVGVFLGLAITFTAWRARGDRQVLISGIRDLIEASPADEERPLE